MIGNKKLAIAGKSRESLPTCRQATLRKSQLTLDIHVTKTMPVLSNIKNFYLLFQRNKAFDVILNVIFKEQRHK